MYENFFLPRVNLLAICNSENIMAHKVFAVLQNEYRTKARLEIFVRVVLSVLDLGVYQNVIRAIASVADRNWETSNLDDGCLDFLQYLRAPRCYFALIFTFQSG